ncbi:hypothetical protein P8625_02920 [Tenacibaculum tangerinum]|uniref:Uncharacterized protein n=1 Tax=Tenacibaculum tangerinum TaxID=3038772 RepID=A0ABY8L3X6_9FLAO|nr:hypothetical protein [Tenacibaculum tangerinum]WGH76136.1 hypothetical protein P8625_02920 [Tenacibaculum tangerinum]
MARRTNKNSNYTPKSGAKLHQSFGSKEGLFMTCWKVSDGVMWSGKVFRSEKQSKVAPTVSRNGKEWCSVTLVLSAPMRDTVVHSGLMNTSNHKVYFKDWNMIINPKASNGGYFGKHISKNY